MPDSSAELGGLSREKFIYLSTTGRITGKTHTVELWFAWRKGKVYLSHEGEQTDWMKNIQKNPDVIPQAITEYEKATSLDPGNAEGWFDLGFMYKQDHQNDKAIAAFNKYLELNKGKDANGRKRIEDEIGALGGTPVTEKKPPGKAPNKKPAPKK